MDNLGVFDTSDVVHLECARYCFLPIINRELYRVIQHWNEHTIRRNRNADCPSGKPDVMYFQPEIYQTRDYKMPIPGNLNGIEQEYCAYPPANGVSMEFEVIGTQIRIENGLNYPPNTVEELSNRTLYPYNKLCRSLINYMYIHRFDSCGYKEVSFSYVLNIV